MARHFTPNNVSLVVALILLLVLLVRPMTSYYQLNARPVTIEAKNTTHLTQLPKKLHCIPGPTPEASPYTVNLDPVGVCGIQETIAEQANYRLVGGIGGSLLDN